MISRKYDKIIEMWITTTVSDGFGGNTVTTAIDYTLWANVTTNNASRTNENGQNDNFVQVVFTIRNNPNLNISIKDNFIKYNNVIYNIDSVLNIDFDNIDIQIQATQRT
jgi:SPP1 family predicted phage head-tail adaptor